jgi:fumarate hydratase subunit beta
MKNLQMPLASEDVQDLVLGEMVELSGYVTMSIGLPTHQRMLSLLQAGDALPVELRGGAFFHLSCYTRERADGAGLEALYLNPTTSTRYNALMPGLVDATGLRLVGGKGGLDRASADAMQRNGCAYLSFLGGGCTLLSRSIKRVVSVHWTEYIEQFRLITLEVDRLGPATVAIDARGNSVYEQLAEQARQELQAARALR